MTYTTKGGKDEASEINLTNLSDKSTLELLKKFKDKKGLEIGCGRGRWLKIFHNIDGCDVNKDYIKEIKKEFGERVWAEDIANPKSTGKKYDFVFSTGLIEHFDDSIKIIKNHIKFLKRGGTCIILVPASGIDGWLNVITLKSNGNRNWREYGRRISDNELDALMNGSGLKDIEIFRIGSILRGSPKSTKLIHLFILHLMGYLIQRVNPNKLEKRYGHVLVGIGKYNPL